MIDYQNKTVCQKTLKKHILKTKKENTLLKSYSMKNYKILIFIIDNNTISISIINDKFIRITIIDSFITLDTFLKILKRYRAYEKKYKSNHNDFYDLFVSKFIKYEKIETSYFYDIIDN